MYSDKNSSFAAIKLQSLWVILHFLSSLWMLFCVNRIDTETRGGDF